MAINLESSPKFREDFIKLTRQISRILDENLKSELEGLLKNLIFEVKKLDTIHGELIMHREISKEVSDSRNKIQEIRKKIDKKLKTISKT